MARVIVRFVYVTSTGFLASFKLMPRVCHGRGPSERPGLEAEGLGLPPGLLRRKEEALPAPVTSRL